jgi:hypothetical protein
LILDVLFGNGMDACGKPKSLKKRLPSLILSPERHAMAKSRERQRQAFMAAIRRIRRVFTFDPLSSVSLDREEAVRLSWRRPVSPRSGAPDAEQSRLDELAS